MFKFVKDFSDEEILIHEFKHDWNDSYGGGIIPSNETTTTGVRCEEVDACNFQNIQRAKENKTPRTTYGGKEIPKENLVPPSEYKIE